MDKKKIENNLGIAIFIAMMIYVATFIFINLFRTYYAMGPDETQTAIVAKIFWEHKSLIPKDFFPWTESGIFSLPTVGMFIYGLTKDLMITQGVTPTIVMILNLLAFYRLLSIMNISKSGRLLGILGILSIPASFARQTITFLSFAAYGMTILTMILVLSDYFLLLSGKMKYKWAHLIFHLFLALANGCNSSRGVLDVYAPLVALEAVRYFLLMLQNKKVWIKDKMLPIVMSFVLMLTSYLSTYLPISSRQITSKAFRRSPIKLVQEVLPCITRWIDYRDKNIFIMSGLIILFTLSLALGCYILYKHNIDDFIQLALAFMWAGVLITVFLLSVTQTDAVDRYFFMINFIFVFSMLYVYERCHTKCRVFVATMVLLYSLINIAEAYVPIIQTPNSAPEYDEIIEYMEDNGYYYGYSDYIHANPITLWANGRVQVSSVYFHDLSIWMWTTSKEWFVPAVDENTKSAIIVPKDNMQDVPEMLERFPDIKEGMETDNYIVYTCDKNHAVCAYDRVN